jgi:hypothetical protein
VEKKAPVIGFLDDNRRFAFKLAPRAGFKMLKLLSILETHLGFVPNFSIYSDDKRLPAYTGSAHPKLGTILGSGWLETY